MVESGERKSSGAGPARPQSGSDRGAPQRVRDLLGPAAARLGIGDPLAAGLLWSRWGRIVGVEIASHAEPSSLRAGVLRVRADSPVWATEIGYLADEIRRRVNEAVRADLVHEVKVWHGPARPGSQIQTGGRAGPRDQSVQSAPAERPADPRAAYRRAESAWRRRLGRGR